MKYSTGYDSFDSYNDIHKSKAVEDFLKKDNNFQRNFWRKVRKNEITFTDAGMYKEDDIND
jgi:hypothetical protein